MLKKGSLLLACLATVAVPTFSQAAPYPTTITSPPPAINLQVPNNVRVNPTIMGKIDKPPSVTCDQLRVALTLHQPYGFPEGGSEAVLSNATPTSCTYKVQIPPTLLGKKVYLWGDLKNPSPLVTVKPVGWTGPLFLPSQVGILQNYNFVVKETIIH